MARVSSTEPDGGMRVNDEPAVQAALVGRAAVPGAPELALAPGFAL